MACCHAFELVTEELLGQRGASWPTGGRGWWAGLISPSRQMQSSQFNQVARLYAHGFSCLKIFLSFPPTLHVVASNSSVYKSQRPRAGIGVCGKAQLHSQQRRQKSQDCRGRCHLGCSNSNGSDRQRTREAHAGRGLFVQKAPYQARVRKTVALNKSLTISFQHDMHLAICILHMLSTA